MCTTLATLSRSFNICRPAKRKTRYLHPSLPFHKPALWCVPASDDLRRDKHAVCSQLRCTSLLPQALARLGRRPTYFSVLLLACHFGVAACCKQQDACKDQSKRGSSPRTGAAAMSACCCRFASGAQTGSHRRAGTRHPGSKLVMLWHKQPFCNARVFLM